MGFLFSKPEPVDMEGPEAKEVQDLIASDKVVIFSKTFCPYCTMAKQAFNGIGQKFTVIELDKRPSDMEKMQTVLAEMTGSRTVPRVFVNGKFIGGGTDCKKLAESGELKKMLDA